MLRNFFAVLCLMAAAYGNTPRPLADVPIPTPDGKTIRLAQYKGKVMVVALISADCADCGKTIDLLTQIQKDYAPKGFQIVASAVNPKDDVATFVSKHHPNFPLGYLEDEQTMKLFDFKRPDHPIVPILMFVDKKGTVRFQYNGDNEAFSKKQETNIRTLVESLLKE